MSEWVFLGLYSVVSLSIGLGAVWVIIEAAIDRKRKKRWPPPSVRNEEHLRREI